MKRAILTLMSCGLLTAVDASCAPKPRVTMTINAIKQELQRIGERDWKLKPIQCPEAFAVKLDMLCFSAEISAEDFADLVDQMDSQTLRPVTGWRDDYGTLNGVFDFKNQPYQVAIAYNRPSSFWDLPRFAELVKRGSQGFVALYVPDEPPIEQKQ